MSAYYLLDSSAFGRYIDPNYKITGTRTHDIMGNIRNGDFYYVPQFCVAEIFNIFAKWHYSENKITSTQYATLRTTFQDMIHNRKMLYPYDLHRYHNLNCDTIYPVEHQTPRTKHHNSWLSTFDILILAMALELKHIHGDITVVSSDVRLIDIATRLGLSVYNYQ